MENQIIILLVIAGLTWVVFNYLSKDDPEKRKNIFSGFIIGAASMAAYYQLNLGE